MARAKSKTDAAEASVDFATEEKRHKPRRRNKETKQIVKAVAAGADPESVTEGEHDKPWKEVDPKWNPFVKTLFEALRYDPLVSMWTPMDWALLRMKCEAWSREFEPKFLGISPQGDVVVDKAPVPGPVLADMTKTLSMMGVTEAGRRAMKILVDPDPAAAAGGGAGGSSADRQAAAAAIVRPARHGISGR